MVDGFGPEERGVSRRHVMRVLGVWKDLEHMTDMVWILFYVSRGSNTLHLESRDSSRGEQAEYRFVALPDGYLRNSLKLAHKSQGDLFKVLQTPNLEILLSALTRCPCSIFLALATKDRLRCSFFCHPTGAWNKATSGIFSFGVFEVS